MGLQLFARCTRVPCMEAAEASWKVRPRDEEIHPVQSPDSLIQAVSLSLPPDVPASELHELLSRKLAQCGVMFDFMDCVADLKGKEVKRAALNELVECVGSTRGVLIEPVYPDIIRMVSTAPSLGDKNPISQLLGPLWEESMSALQLGLRAVLPFPLSPTLPNTLSGLPPLLSLYLSELGLGYLSSRPLVFHGLTQAWVIL